jgi:photosystem II stability/assembly factor-like uncharacterized protein
MGDTVVENSTEHGAGHIENETQVQDLVYSIAASPNFAQDAVCFAARQSGLYRSDDAGASWTPVYDSLDLEAPLATMAVAVSPDFASDSCVFAGVAGGILRSVDGGQTWNAVLLPEPPPIVSALAVSPDFSRDSILLAGTLEDGVFRSADRGGRWARWNFGLLDLEVFCMALSPSFADDETVFVGTESGIFRSTNGGRAWREVDFSLELAPVLSLAISPGYASEEEGGGTGVLFAGTETCGLYRSEDRGRTWTRLGEDTITGPINGILLASGVSSPATILVALSDRLLISRDGGESWSDWETGASFESGITCVTAPLGLDEGSPVLVGLAEGGVQTV